MPVHDLPQEFQARWVQTQHEGFEVLDADDDGPRLPLQCSFTPTVKSGNFSLNVDEYPVAQLRVDHQRFDVCDLHTDARSVSVSSGISEIAWKVTCAGRHDGGHGKIRFCLLMPGQHSIRAGGLTMTFASDCLQGKVILITGGLGAIGKVVVQKLLAHKACVVVNDIVVEEEAQEWMRTSGSPSDRCVYINADVTAEAGAEALVDKAVRSFGAVHVALCHAGMAQSCSILDYTAQDWDRIVRVNLRSAFLVAQAAARAMLAQKVMGKIIFTSSWVQDTPWPDITPYNVTKSGIKMLMRGMARELAAKGIRVNSIAPGIVAVGMAKREWDTEPNYRRRAEKAIPLGFMQPPESVADAFIFLCSRASDYMTGATLMVDGGCSLYPMD